MLLQLVSPERVLVDEQVDEVQVPGLDGYMGILPGHAPLLSELMAGGVLKYRTGSGESVFAVYGGFVEVQPDRVRILADFAERRGRNQPGRSPRAVEQNRSRLAG